jgi:L-amino acid N-acyltransferase YncA
MSQVFFIAVIFRKFTRKGKYVNRMGRLKQFTDAMGRFVSGLKRHSKATNLRLLRKRGEDISSIVIREAVAGDIPQLSALHVKTWGDTYWAVRKPPTYAIREYQWREQFTIHDGSWFCYVVQNSRGELVGFAKGRKYASADLPGYAGELNKIYLLWEYHRLGLGKKLVKQVARRFLSEGISSMVLFGSPRNPSCAFHEAIGGQRLYAKNGEFHGGYGWKDLNTLIYL